jgi:hypothetical protein
LEGPHRAADNGGETVKTNLLEVVDEVRRHLAQNGRVSFRMLRRQFELDEETLEDLIEELVDIQCVARREGNALAWAQAALVKTVPAPEPDPRSHMPKHLADKILTARSGLEGSKGAYRLVTPVDKLEVPSSVPALLAARIDRLAQRDKDVLQTAAVIGREFDEPTLAAVVEQDAPQLREALQTLKDTEFVYEQSLYPVAEYLFKHPLTQEVALASQLQERRKRLHAAVARVIEAAHAHDLDQQAALLAHHWEQAGEALATDGVAGGTAIDAALGAATALMEATDARLYAPSIHAERARLARLRGDAAACERDLDAARRLFIAMGAPARAEQIAKEVRT